ncbi:MULTISPECIES: hypothetical protein [Butyricimonas]|uniref:hypothetical protein n=1 Tax=Butyricimonas TaxID=574697 RepID=UPI0007FB409A|nr:MULTISPECIES: hypothetical protein [Butyricimonas]
MKWIYLLLCSLMALVCFSSCYDEKALTPTEDGEGMSRYEFPQGTNAWDKDIEEISEKFNIYLIYKNFKHADFNRSWTGGGVYTEYYGEDLSDEQAERATRFMKEHVFAYLNEKIVSKVLPMYWYMVYDLHVMNILIPGILEFKNPQPMYDGGLDFWAICLEGEDPADSGYMPGGNKIDFPVTKRDFFKRRGQILESILLKSLDKGNFEIPASFETGFDYKTEVKSNDWEMDDENYYLTRGFPGSPGSGTIGDGFYPLVYIGDMSNVRNFRTYIKFCLYYSVAELDEKYPRSKYPLLREKRDFVANYMKTTYGVDFDAIIEGPEVEE